MKLVLVKRNFDLFIIYYFLIL